MKFIDGILPPRTISTGSVVADGRAYFVLGNSLIVIKSLHVADLLELTDSHFNNAARSPIGRPNTGSVRLSISTEPA